MRKRLLFTSVAVLNTLASVAVPTVASAETTDTTNSNTNTEVPAPQVSSEQEEDTITTRSAETDQAEKAAPAEEKTEEAASQDEQAPEAASEQDENDALVANSQSRVLAGPKEEEADQSVAHSTDISDLGKDEAMPLPMTRMSPYAFINLAGPMAQRSAQKYGVYASVMMAQAIIESGWGGSTLAMAPNYNLFGIKGAYNGQSVYMRTREYSPKYGWYYINAAFRKYPSYEQSFNDNGALLRYGLNGYYKGTWKENTNSYRDATRWLQGRYATAPNYAAVLNNTIAAYNLTRFDSAPADTNAASQAPLNGTRYDMDDVATIKNPKGAQLYNQAHPDLPIRGTLSKGTQWRVTGKVITPQGATYYQVSSREYIKAEDVDIKSDSIPLNGTRTAMNDVGTVTNASGAKIYTQANPDLVSKRYLAANSAWKITGKVVTPDNKTYYQVSSKEYVKASDLRLKSDTKVIKVNNKEGAVIPLVGFNANGTTFEGNRGLSNNSSWLTDKSREYNGHKYYRVSTNEWIMDSYVSSVQ